MRDEELKALAAEYQQKIADALGVTPTDQQRRDAEDFLYGFALEAKGKGIQDGVLARVLKRRAG